MEQIQEKSTDKPTEKSTTKKSILKKSYSKKGGICLCLQISLEN